jgi:hypothetical protein
VSKVFLVNTVLDWMDNKYQLLRKKLPSRRRYSYLDKLFVFESWDALLDFMLDSFDGSLVS